MPAQTHAATQEHMRRAAERAATDPVQRARALRVIRAALALQLISPTEVVPEQGRP